MTDFESLLLDELRDLRKGQGVQAELLARIDERLEDVENRLPPPAQLVAVEPEPSLPAKSRKGWAAAVGTALGAAVAGAIAALVK